MLSTTVEPKCPETVGPRMTTGADVHDAPTREATKVLAHATIQPTAGRAGAYSTTAPADSAAVR
jgi:hypothetical protein